MLVTPRRMATAALLALCWPPSAALFAQESARKEATASSIPLMADVKQGVLKNGVSYIVRSTGTEAGPTQVTLLVKAGSNFDDPLGSEIAHILEHLALLGTRSDPNGGIQALYRSAGVPGGYGGSTSPDHTRYYIDLVPAVALTAESAIGLLRGVASELDLPTAEVEAQKGAVIGERRGGDPSVEMANLVEAALDIRDGRRRAMDANIIPAVTRDKIVAYYRRWYTPDRFVVTVSGSGDPDRWIKAITDQFGNIPKRKSREAERRPPYRPIKSSTKIIPGALKEKASLNFMTFARAPTGELSGVKTELFNVLVARRAAKIALVRSRQVDGLQFAWRDRQYGILGSESGLHGRVVLREGVEMSAAEDTLLSIVASIRSRPFDDAEMAYARAQFGSWRPSEYSENNSSISNSIIASVMSGAPLLDGRAQFNAITNSVDSITSADMTAFARALVDVREPIVIVASPAIGSSQPFSASGIRQKLQRAVSSTATASEDVEVQISAASTPRDKRLFDDRKLSTDEFGRRHLILRNGIPVMLLSAPAPQVQIAAVRRSVFYDGSANVGALVRSPRATAKNLLTYDGRATLNATASFNGVQVVPMIDRFGAQIWLNTTQQSARPAFEILNRIFTLDGSEAYAPVLKGTYALDERRLSPLLVAGETDTSIEAKAAERFFDLNFSDPRGYQLVIASPLSDGEVLGLLDTYIGNIPIDNERSLADISSTFSLRVGPYRVDTAAATRSIDQRLFIVTIGNFSRSEQLQAELASYVLNARLFDLVREKLGGAYAPFANIEIRGNPTRGTAEMVLQIGMEIDQSRRDELVGAVQGELRKILTEGIEQHEFDTKKQALRIAVARQIDALGSDAAAAAEELQTGRRIAEPGDLILIDAMQNDDRFQETVEKIFRPDDIGMISRPIAN